MKPPLWQHYSSKLPESTERLREETAFLMHANNSDTACFPTGKIAVAYSTLDTLSHYTIQTYRGLLTIFLTRSKLFLAVSTSMT